MIGYVVCVMYVKEEKTVHTTAHNKISNSGLPTLHPGMCICVHKIGGIVCLC
jgi:hypothetical protein